jgi:hypothetical protein
MKNITRLALAMAVATIACFAPVAHADDPETRHYDYSDADGHGTMVVHDRSKLPGGVVIYVTIYQNGQTYSGWGKRNDPSSPMGWLAYCEFLVKGSGVSAQFEGYLPMPPGYSTGGGEYFVNGSGVPHPWKAKSADLVNELTGRAPGSGVGGGGFPGGGVGGGGFPGGGGRGGGRR